MRDSNNVWLNSTPEQRRRIREALWWKRQHGYYVGPLPLGFIKRRPYPGGIATLEPDGKKSVALVFAYYGIPERRIRNGMGLAAFLTEALGKKFTRSQAKALLLKPVYKGWTRSSVNSPWKKGAFEGLVPEALFDLVASIISQKGW